MVNQAAVQGSILSNDLKWCAMRTFERLVRLKRYANAVGKDFNVDCIDITALSSNRIIPNFTDEDQND